MEPTAARAAGTPDGSRRDAPAGPGRDRTDDPTDDPTDRPGRDPAGDPARGPVRSYVERLRAPWWLWLGALAAAVLLAAEVHLGYGGSRAWVPYAVAVPVTVVGLWWLGRIRVAVEDGELRVDDAHIPLDLLAAAESVPRTDLREALGRDLDPVAFVVHRPWVRSAVRVYLDDPADPTPYWLVSTRQPAALLDALDLPLPAPPADTDR